MKSVAFLTLGCKVNAYETDKMRQAFLNAGYEIRDFKDQADVYVVNTCTVTNMADRKSRQMLHRAKKNNPDSIIVATGCYVDSSAKQGNTDEMIDIPVPNSQKENLVRLVEEYQRERQGMLQDVDTKWDADIDIEERPNGETLPGEHTRAYIKVQDGCNQFCSYCIIPHVRGRLHSRTEEDVLKEVSGLAEAGYKEVVVTGIHLSSYGVDLQGEKNFLKLEGRPLLSLLSAIAGIGGIQRIRLGSLEPRIITEAFAKKLSGIEKICPHFHLSLQSGCDATLKRMNRHYTTKEYEEKTAILRKYFELPAITTDVIVGFPGETDEEFYTTESFLRGIGFAEMHIFKYSRRKGTVADGMEQQINEQIKTERSGILLELAQNMKDTYRHTFINKKQKVLWEEKVVINEKEYFIGHNERYLRIAVLVPESRELSNKITEVLVTGVLDEDTLEAETVS